MTDWASALMGRDVLGFTISKTCGLSHLRISINGNFIDEIDNCPYDKIFSK